MTEIKISMTGKCTMYIPEKHLKCEETLPQLSTSRSLLHSCYCFTDKFHDASEHAEITFIRAVFVVFVDDDHHVLQTVHQLLFFLDFLFQQLPIHNATALIFVMRSDIILTCAWTLTVNPA